MKKCSSFSQNRKFIIVRGFLCIDYNISRIELQTYFFYCVRLNFFTIPITLIFLLACLQTTNMRSFGKEHRGIHSVS